MEAQRVRAVRSLTACPSPHSLLRPPPHRAVYASFYYRRACALRPHDARMWCALGTCFESLERRGDAIACFERAALFADHRDGAAALRLAKLYRQAGNVAAACRWYAVHVEEKEAGAGSGLGAGAAGSDVAEALLYLAGAAKAEGRVGRG